MFNNTRKQVNFYPIINLIFIPYGVPRVERLFYQPLGAGSDTKIYQQPDVQETERFLTKIWQPKKHNENAAWINNITRELEGLEEGPQTEIHTDLLKTDTKKNIKLESARPWWNTWLLVQEIRLHSPQTSTRNEQMLTRHASNWMDDQRKDYINPKKPKQRKCSKQLQTENLPTNDVENTNSTNKPWIVPCRKGSRGIAELHYIDQHIVNESKTRRQNLAMVWIDYKMAFDMLPQRWILHCLKMYKISHEVINFMEQTMQTWRVEQTASRRSLAETKIQRGIFQGDVLSPLLFLIAMIPLNHILRKCTAGYKLSRSQEKINHLMYMDDIKLLKRTGNSHTRR